MATPVNLHFGMALKQLRSGVAFCCWIVGLALIVQTIAWSLLTFTDLRYEKFERDPERSETKVVPAEVVRRDAIRGAAEHDENLVPVEVNRQRSRFDHFFRVATNIMSAAGTLALIALLPMMGLAVVTAAGSATRGIERTASSFVWATLLVVVALPISRWFGSVQFDGVFVPYDRLANHVEAAREGVRGVGLRNAPAIGLLFYARYCLLPLACLAGVGAITFRFRSGIEAGMIPKPDLRLDPELEKEVANIKASNLHGGGRTVGALRNAMKIEEGEFQRGETATIRQVSAGERPARPI